MMSMPSSISGRELRDMYVNAALVCFTVLLPHRTPVNRRMLQKWGCSYDVRLVRRNGRMYLHVMCVFLHFVYRWLGTNFILVGKKLQLWLPCEFCSIFQCFKSLKSYQSLCAQMFRLAGCVVKPCAS